MSQLPSILYYCQTYIEPERSVLSETSDQLLEFMEFVDPWPRKILDACNKRYPGNLDKKEEVVQFVGKTYKDLARLKELGLDLPLRVTEKGDILTCGDAKEDLDGESSQSKYS